jgi:hypothetical protein
MNPTFRLALIAAAVGACCHSPAFAQSNADIAAEMKRMREELAQVRGELEALKAAKSQAPVAVVAPLHEAASTSVSAATAVPLVGGNAGSGLSLFGYGEMGYSRPRKDASNASATVGRSVLGWAYRFNDRTRMAAELEVENAVVSAGDKGEVALEQFYVEHDVQMASLGNISAKAGLFLLPIGYMNEVHEPTRYFGVNRNLVETAIIPSTWREMGVGLRGTTEAGLRWDAGVVTSFDLTKWDATSTDGQDSPLRAIHQEGQLAKARNMAAYGAVNFNGIPGFNVGGSVFAGGVGHKQVGFAAPDASVTLAEVHARWQPGRWDISTLAATGRFSNVAALNATFAGQATPVPSRFGGAYVQAAYRIWQSGDYALYPFARYERLNTARGYDGLAQGLAPAIAPDTKALTVGANFYLHPQVVLKADMQKFQNNSALDKFNLGLGFHF